MTCQSSTCTRLPVTSSNTRPQHNHKTAQPTVIRHPKTRTAKGRAAAGAAAGAAAPSLHTGRAPCQADWSWAGEQGFDWLTLQGPIPVRRKLPPHIRNAYAAAMATILPRCAEGERAAWWLLLALPRLCIPSCPPGQDPKHDAYNMLSLCRMFTEGRWEQLVDLATWREGNMTSGGAASGRLPRRAARDAGAGDDKLRFTAAQTLMEIGEYSKAMHRLASTEKVKDITDEALNTLRSLHPSVGALSDHSRSIYEAVHQSMLNGFVSPAAEAAAGAAPNSNHDLNDTDVPGAFKPIELCAKRLKKAIVSAPKGSAGAGTG